MNNLKNIAKFFFVSTVFFYSLAIASGEYSFSQEKFLNGVASVDMGGEAVKMPTEIFVELYEGVTLSDGTHPRFIRWESSSYKPEVGIYKVEAIFDHGDDVDEPVRFIFFATPRNVDSKGNYLSEIFFVELGNQVKMKASEYFYLIKDALP